MGAGMKDYLAKQQRAMIPDASQANWLGDCLHLLQHDEKCGRYQQPVNSPQTTKKMAQNEDIELSLSKLECGNTLRQDAIRAFHGNPVPKTNTHFLTFLHHPSNPPSLVPQPPQLTCFRLVFFPLSFPYPFPT